MVSTRDYRSLTETIVSQQQGKEDFLVPATQLKMTMDERLKFGETSYGMNRIAHTQVASRLKVPTAFYDRLGNYAGLRTTVVNRLLSEDQRTFFVRTLEGQSRAVLSDRYKPIDNVDVLSAAAPVLRDMDITFRAAELTESRMYLQVTFPKMEADVGVGDIVQYGLTITNSEVGMGMVRVSPTLWRLVCANGMVRQTQIKHRHVGRQMEMAEDFGIYRDETIKADLAAFRMKLQDTIQVSASEAIFQDFVDRARRSGEDIVNSVSKTIKNVTREFNFSEEVQQSLMDAMAIEDGAPSRWKIANAVTGLAHKEKSSDAQFEYEKIGAEIVDMGESKWRKLAA